MHKMSLFELLVDRIVYGESLFELLVDRIVYGE